MQTISNNLANRKCSKKGRKLANKISSHSTLQNLVCLNKIKRQPIKCSKRTLPTSNKVVIVIKIYASFS